MENAVELSGVMKAFQMKEVLKDITLNVEKGEIFGLLGPSGAGKTTLIKLITAQMKADEGSIKVLGMTVQEKSRIYGEMGTMLDDAGIYERFSCFDNLKIFADIYGIQNNRIQEVLEQVGLGKEVRTLAARLSKGMAQRLVFARAILREPKLLFMDEPTSALDPAMTAEIHNLIQEQKGKGATIFLTTHNMEEAAKLCDHVALIHEGKIVEYGSPKELCLKYNELNQIRILLADGQLIQLPNTADSSVQIGQLFAQKQIVSIHSTEPDLETVFMKLTGKRLV